MLIVVPSMKKRNKKANLNKKISENTNKCEFIDIKYTFNWLKFHPKFIGMGGNTDTHFNDCLDIEITKVNPKTLEIDDDRINNTKIQVWLECGEYSPYFRNHDIDLDCGADTFEEAIMELAQLVYDKFGDYKNKFWE